MTDMLLGLLVIFLIIVAYLVLSFSQSLEKARSADEAERRAAIAVQAAEVARQAADAANADFRNSSWDPLTLRQINPGGRRRQALASLRV